MRSAVVRRLRRADYVRWCLKAEAAGSQPRGDAQGAAGSFALGSRVCLCEAAGTLTYVARAAGSVTCTIRMSMRREGGRLLCSKQKGGRLLREKTAAGSFPWSHKGGSLFRQEIAAGSFALCRKGAPSLNGNMPSHCRSTMQF